MSCLIALHAHPDDESSKGAGTVAKYADAGTRCILVTFTGGEAGDILNPAMDTPAVRESLAEVRRGELDEAAAIIGYSEVVMLGFRDSGMADSVDNAHPDALANAEDDDVLRPLVRIVRASRPDVLLGYDAHERYPHPDHLAVHRLGLDLFVAAADPERFPEEGDPWSVPVMFAPTFTARRLLTLHEAMLERTGDSPLADWVAGLDTATDGDKAVLSVDVADTFERSRDALRAHRTQVDPDGGWFRVPSDVIRDVYPYEDFELLAGRVQVEAGASDLLAHVR